MICISPGRFLATVMAVASATWLVTTIISHAPPISPLTAGLDSMEWRAASAAFDARVRRRFPIGTPTDALVAALQAEGFEPEWSTSAVLDGGSGAHRASGGFPCAVDAHVGWTLDRSRRYVTAVRGFRQQSCL